MTSALANAQQGPFRPNAESYPSPEVILRAALVTGQSDDYVLLNGAPTHLAAKRMGRLSPLGCAQLRIRLTIDTDSAYQKYQKSRDLQDFRVITTSTESQLRCMSSDTYPDILDEEVEEDPVEECYFKKKRVECDDMRREFGNRRPLGN